METKRDNYTDNAKKLFLKENQEKLIKKFGLKTDDLYLYLRFMDMTYRIERKTGNIQKSFDNISFEDDLSHNAALSIFDYLCWSREDRTLSGIWESLLSMGYSFHRNLLEGKGGLFEVGAAKFSGNAEKLEKVLRNLNGQKMPTGDVGYILWLFDEFPVYFQFWEGDDEFPPKVFVLWDKNTQQYIHYETAYYVLNMLLDRISELFDCE